MFKNTTLLKYAPALMINLILAYPFIHFLLSPQDATSKFIMSIGYILFLRVASLGITTQVISYKLSHKINYLSLLIPILILWKVFHEASSVLVFYFIGGVIVDLMTIYQTKAKEMLNLVLSGIARSMLLLGLLVPASLISWLVPKKSFIAITANSNTDAYYKDAGNLIFVIVLFILYYLFEPFAQPIFDMVFDPKSKLAKLLNKKI